MYEQSGGATRKYEARSDAERKKRLYVGGGERKRIRKANKPKREKKRREQRAREKGER